MTPESFHRCNISAMLKKNIGIKTACRINKHVPTTSERQLVHPLSSLWPWVFFLQNQRNSLRVHADPSCLLQLQCSCWIQMPSKSVVSTVLHFTQAQLRGFLFFRSMRCPFVQPRSVRRSRSHIPDHSTLLCFIIGHLEQPQCGLDYRHKAKHFSNCWHSMCVFMCIL